MSMFFVEFHSKVAAVIIIFAANMFNVGLKCYEIPNCKEKTEIGMLYYYML